MKEIPACLLSHRIPLYGQWPGIYRDQYKVSTCSIHYVVVMNPESAHNWLQLIRTLSGRSSDS